MHNAQTTELIGYHCTLKDYLFGKATKNVNGFCTTRGSIFNSSQNMLKTIFVNFMICHKFLKKLRHSFFATSLLTPSKILTKNSFVRKFACMHKGWAAQPTQNYDLYVYRHEDVVFTEQRQNKQNIF